MGRGKANKGHLVSIPERVWGWLERHSQTAVKAYHKKFQTQRGIGDGSSNTIGIAGGRSFPFQSLRGFGVGWSKLSRLPEAFSSRFNP